MTRNRLYSLLLLACLGGFLWLLYAYLQGPKTGLPELNVCVFKAATGVACPSCGATRSVMALAGGDVAGALYFNPFGIIIAAVMLFVPLWIGFDVIRRKESLATFYSKTEVFISKKAIAVPAILLVLANWIWNIYKDL